MRCRIRTAVRIGLVGGILHPANLALVVERRRVKKSRKLLICVGIAEVLVAERHAIRRMRPS